MHRELGLAERGFLSCQNSPREAKAGCLLIFQRQFGFWGSRSQSGKLRLLFRFWGIKVASWQVAALVWVLGDQIELWPGQSQSLSGQSTTLAPDGRQDNLASCLAPYQAVIMGNNLPNCLPDIGAVIGWLWAVWPT
ncbi:hypothetical protein B0H14DRAFT_2597288 [Mycena olivaceomarginata]|nr:hypothetical protein B0H14DRAFT_2597288 [Mycena olivaceomarginata]